MPNAPPPTYAFGAETVAPPVPAEGLPAGWSMEQWNHYGQQWLEGQQGSSSTTVSQTIATEPTYVAPEPSYVAPEPTYDAPEPTHANPVESGKSRGLSEPLPSTDILDFDL